MTRRDVGRDVEPDGETPVTGDDEWLAEPLERSGLLREAKAILLPAAVRRGLERVLRYVPAGLAAAAEAAFPRSRVEMLVAAVGEDLGVALAELEAAVRSARDEGLEGADLEVMGAAARQLREWQARRDAGGLLWGSPGEAPAGPPSAPSSPRRERPAGGPGDPGPGDSGSGDDASPGSPREAGGDGSGDRPGPAPRRGPSLLREVEAIFLPGKVRGEMDDLLAHLEDMGQMLDDAVAEMDEPLSVVLARAAARDLRSAVATLEAALREARPDRLDPLGQRVVDEVRKQLPGLLTLAAGLAEELGEEPEGELGGKIDEKSEEKSDEESDEGLGEAAADEPSQDTEES